MTTSSAAQTLTSGYIPVGGLNIYYEVEGSGPPLVLLHGGLTTIAYSFGKIRPHLAKSWTTIAIEQQAHGHTADIDRPITYHDMADDTAAVLRELKIEQADFFGWSDGGNVGLQIAIRHPGLVRKLAVFGSFFRIDGLYPEIIAFFEHATPDDFGEDIRAAYAKAAPRPGDWAALIDKIKATALPPEHWDEAKLRTITAPVLFMVGDADIVKPEHAVDVFRLLQHGQLAVLPGTNHFAPVSKPELIFEMAEAFFKAPMPKPKKPAAFGA